MGSAYALPIFLWQAATSHNSAGTTPSPSVTFPAGYSMQAQCKPQEAVNIAKSTIAV
jgi:hypothetical protein